MAKIKGEAVVATLPAWQIDSSHTTDTQNEMFSPGFQPARAVYDGLGRKPVGKNAPSFFLWFSQEPPQEGGMGLPF